jgi:hypothetical protein
LCLAPIGGIISENENKNSQNHQNKHIGPSAEAHL